MADDPFNPSKRGEEKIYDSPPKGMIVDCISNDCSE